MSARAIGCAVAALLALAACRNGGSSFAELLGVKDKPVAQPVTIDVLCDPSRGSTCTKATLRLVLTQSLNTAVDRPGSSVRLWMQGHDVATTCMIAAAISSRTKLTGKHSKLRHQQRWVSTQVRILTDKAAVHLLKKRRRSPIAESITRAALARTESPMPRVLIVVSDGLEVSTFGDFECGTLPSAKRFVRDLQHNNVLPARSLSGISVHFSHADLAPIDGERCAVTLKRVGEISNLWSAAIRAAGAERFQIDRGDARLQISSEE